MTTPEKPAKRTAISDYNDYKEYKQMSIASDSIKALTKQGTISSNTVSAERAKEILEGLKSLSNVNFKLYDPMVTTGVIKK